MSELDTRIALLVNPTWTTFYEREKANITDSAQLAELERCPDWMKNGLVDGVPEISELTTRLRELLAKATKGPMRASVTDKVRVLTSDGLFLADFGHDLNGAADDARLYIESKLALPTLLDHIEAQDRRIAELEKALQREKALATELDDWSETVIGIARVRIETPEGREKLGSREFWMSRFERWERIRHRFWHHIHGDTCTALGHVEFVEWLRTAMESGHEQPEWAQELWRALEGQS